MNRKRQETLFRKRQPNILDIPYMVAVLNSDDYDAQFGAIQFRNLLSIEHDPPIWEVIQARVVPRFVEFLGLDHLPDLQSKTAWFLSFITTGTSEQVQVVIDHGAVPILVKLLSSTDNDDVRKWAVLALGYVARQSSACRDLILESDEWNQLLCQLSEHSTVSMIRIATGTLLKLSERMPLPSLNQLNPAIPILARLVVHSNDEERLRNTVESSNTLMTN